MEANDTSPCYTENMANDMTTSNKADLEIHRCGVNTFVSDIPREH